MNIEEAKEQLHNLIEAWQLNEAVLNQTDINAIKCLLEENEQLKQQLNQKKAIIKDINRFVNWSKAFNDEILVSIREILMKEDIVPINFELLIAKQKQDKSLTQQLNQKNKIIKDTSIYIDSCMSSSKSFYGTEISKILNLTLENIKNILSEGSDM